jgi:hypothetical protein
LANPSANAPTSEERHINLRKRAELSSAILLYLATGLSTMLPAKDNVAHLATKMGFGWGDNPGDSADIMEGWRTYHSEHPNEPFKPLWLL